MLELVPGDGHPVRRQRRPRHVHPRGRLLAELRTSESGRSGRAGLKIRHADEHVDHGVVAVHRVVHLTTIELGYHLSVEGLRLPVVTILRLIVQRCVLRHADLSGGGVDYEQPRVRGVALQRVAQRLVVIGRSRHGVANSRPGGRVLGDATGLIRGDADGSGARHGAAVPVRGRVVDFGRALVEQSSLQMGAPGRPGQIHPKQGGMLCRCRVGQPVAVSVLEEYPQRSLARLFVVGSGADGERAAVEGDGGGRRWCIRRALASVRPGAESLVCNGDDRARLLFIDDGDDGALDGQPRGRAGHDDALAALRIRVGHAGEGQLERPAGLAIGNSHVGQGPDCVVDPRRGSAREGKVNGHGAGRASPGRGDRDLSR